MPKKIDVRIILEELFRGTSENGIASTYHCSKHSVQDVRRIAKEKKILPSGEIPDLTDEGLYKLFFPDTNTQEEIFQPVDYEYVHKELNKVGVTLKQLWDEYQEDIPEGKIPVSYSKFTKGYTAYIGSKGFANHIVHKAGDRIEVDWSGPTMHYLDIGTGKQVKVYLFVSDLVSSRLAYVEPTLDMKEQTWIQCHINMWKYYGGVSRILVCDNLLTGVQQHPKDGEIVLTRDYEMLMEHYGTAVMPCAVKSPRQKNSTENTVFNAALSIIAPLRNIEFTSFFDLKEAVGERLEALNNAHFQKRSGSRRSDYEENERALLRPLPSVPFDVGKWYYDRSIQPNCHVSFEKNWYSCPFAYRESLVDLKVTATEVMLYIGKNMIKRHLRFPAGVTNRYRTDVNDLPKGSGFTEWDAPRIRRWAKSIGPSTEAVIDRILSSRSIVEQTFNSALAVLHLTNRFEKERIERASGIALSKVTSPRYRDLNSILSSGKDKEEERNAMEKAGAIKGILKGQAYFERFGGEHND
jgi:transposase